MRDKREREPDGSFVVIGPSWWRRAARWFTAHWRQMLAIVWIGGLWFCGTGAAIELPDMLRGVQFLEDRWSNLDNTVLLVQWLVLGLCGWLVLRVLGSPHKQDPR